MQSAELPYFKWLLNLRREMATVQTISLQSPGIINPPCLREEGKPRSGPPTLVFIRYNLLCSSHCADPNHANKNPENADFLHTSTIIGLYFANEDLQFQAHL